MTRFINVGKFWYGEKMKLNPNGTIAKSNFMFNQVDILHTNNVSEIDETLVRKTKVGEIVATHHRSQLWLRVDGRKHQGSCFLRIE